LVRVVATAWAKANFFHANAAAKAEERLLLQHELCSATELSKDAMPDFQGYALVILAHSYSRNPQKVIDARRLLDSLLEHVKVGGIKVSGKSSAPFSAVLSAAAQSPPCVIGASPSKEALDWFNDVVDTTTDAFAIADKTYRELRDDSYGIGVAPDHHAFGAFLQCIAKHTSPESAEREAKARMVFDDACEAGHVSRLVVEGVKDCVGQSMRDIPGLESNELSRFWTRNVPRVWRYKGI
jgi:hypothetical protein